MGEAERTSGSSVNDTTPSDPEELRSEIEETRRELGDTVAAISAKTDVKAQAHQRAEEVKSSLGEKKDEFVAKAQNLGGKAQNVSPESVQSAASTGAVKVRENPVPVAVIAAFAVGFLVGRLTSR